MKKNLLIALVCLLFCLLPMVALAQTDDTNGVSASIDTVDGVTTLTASCDGVTVTSSRAVYQPGDDRPEPVITIECTPEFPGFEVAYGEETYFYLWDREDRTFLLDWYNVPGVSASLTLLENGLPKVYLLRIQDEERAFLHDAAWHEGALLLTDTDIHALPHSADDARQMRGITDESLRWDLMDSLVGVWRRYISDYDWCCLTLRYDGTCNEDFDSYYEPQGSWAIEGDVFRLNLGEEKEYEYFIEELSGGTVLLTLKNEQETLVYSLEDHASMGNG